MPLETATYISELDPTNPVGSSDLVSSLDDHMRLVKATLQNTFPNIDGAVNATEDQINLLAATSPNDRVLRISSGAVGWGQLTAGMFPSQVVPDGALSSNVPLLNAPNTFTRSGAGLGSAAITIAANAPTLLMHETDQDANGGLWVFSLAVGQFRLAAVPDNYSGNISAGSMLLNATRSGTQITSATLNGGNEVELNATTLDFNGNADISGTLAVGGAATFSNNVTVGGTSTPILTVERVGSASNAVIETKTTAGSVYFGNTNGSTFAIGASSGLSSPWVTVSQTAFVVGGAVRARTIATSTSSTLAVGQVHAITGNATLPNMTTGQWVGVINNSNSPITVTKNASDTMYWTASGASVTSVTVAARGKAAFFAASDTNVYASGNITGAS